MKRRKMSIEQYLESEFSPGSEPCRKTVINWIKSDVIDGVELGGKYWVYETVTEADILTERVLKSA